MLMFNCPMCQCSYEVEDDLAGKVIVCRECGECSRVRTPPASAPDASPEAKPIPQPPLGMRVHWLPAALCAGVLGLVVLVVFTIVSKPASQPSGIPPTDRSGDDLRAIRESLERQEKAARKREQESRERELEQRAEQARKERSERFAKDLDALGEWNRRQQKQNMDRLDEAFDGKVRPERVIIPPGRP